MKLFRIEGVSAPSIVILLVLLYDRLWSIWIAGSAEMEDGCGNQPYYEYGKKRRDRDQRRWDLLYKKEL